MSTNASAQLDEVEVSDPDRLVKQPLVSVLMITYNHAAYLAQAIEGVVSQQCDFPFELIIGEDASKDDTRSIALDYQRRYPHIVRVIYSATNVGMNENSRRIFLRARGEFIASCEGDDYWCSVEKLTGQIALMSRDKRVGIVHADWVRSRHGSDGWKVAWGKSVHRRVPRVLLEGDIFSAFYYPKILRTCTVLVRKAIVEEYGKSELGCKEYKFGDTVLAAFVTSRWKVAYLPTIAAVYRESPNSALRSGRRARLEFLKSGLEFDTDARRFFADRNDYPEAYRWELAIGLLLWSITARDGGAVKFACSDIRKHFSPWTFVMAAWKTVMMRRPTLLRQCRADPSPGLISDSRMAGQ